MNILFPAKALAAADSGGFIDAADFAGAGLPGFAEAPGKADVSDLGVIFLTYERAVHITEHGAGAEAKAIKVGAGTAEDIVQIEREDKTVVKHRLLHSDIHRIEIVQFEVAVGDRRAVEAVQLHLPVFREDECEAGVAGKGE